MADEQYGWLDRETAERLLSGEPLDALDTAARDQAERLVKTLGALSAAPPPTGAELPGEAAALAAFRQVRTDRAAQHAPAGSSSDECVFSGSAVDDAGSRTAPPSDAGLFRLGARSARHTGDTRAPRWGRPVRLALSAVLAVGMVGGVAVAAGTGFLPAPFGGAEPGPAASVSAPVAPDRPLVSPPPKGPATEADWRAATMALPVLWTW